MSGKRGFQPIQGLSTSFRRRNTSETLISILIDLRRKQINAAQETYRRCRLNRFFMTREYDNDSYSPDNLLVVTSASCLSSITLEGIFYWGISSELVMTFLIASIWCVVGNFSVLIVTIPLGKSIKRLLPSWLLVPSFGTTLSVFSYFLFAYWRAVSDYIPNSPFSVPPPMLSHVLYVASIINLLFGSISVFVCLAAFGMYRARDRALDLRL